MPEIPECLNKRYKALDELIQELSGRNSRHSHYDDLPCRDVNSNEPGIKLMCDFWNILKEDPDCNLTQAVKQRMGLQTESGAFKPQHITCFLAKKSADDKKKGAGCQHSSEKSQKSCCSSSPRSPAPAGSDVMPLSKVLCNLKEAASFDKKCNARINDLIRTQKELQEQITHLESREREGVQLLKQADCMWSCMEEAYKKRLAESLHRQRDLMKELKEAEKNNTKWRKNKKDLDSQVDRINKCHQNILDKLAQKNNDLKCMDMEIADFKKRIENNKKEAEAAKNSIVTKKQNSDAKIANLASEVTRLNKCLTEEVKNKQRKEQEGGKLVKEAREELQQISKVLLQKKIENEDRIAEKNAVEQDIELLKQTCEQCQDKCKNNQQTMINEIKKLDQEIKDFKVKCIRCHQCTDTNDARKFCNDCPKCMAERECLNKIDHCERDLTMDCVCMTVKHKFLDNVFENMYTVLERQSKTRPGKAVADSVLKCLKNSRNGKLNVDTRKILQDFILDTVRKNLNLTIVGGAVKTRCELDPETYQQLMTCLKKVTPVKPTKEDKGTAARKETCARWGGSDECNCPGGPKYCVCKARAPLPPKEPDSCPPTVYNKDDLKQGEAQACPNKASTSCGPDCYARGPALESELSTYRKDPCAPNTCSFGTNMRAAQCVLGPESLSSAAPYSVTPLLPYDVTDYVDMKCKSCSTKPVDKDDCANQLKAEVAKFCDHTCSTISYQTANEKESEDKDKKSYLKYPENDVTKVTKEKVVQPLDSQKNSVTFHEKHLNKQNRNKMLNVIKGKDIDDGIKNKLKMVTRASNTNRDEPFTFLTLSPSGKLAVDLDADTIETIAKKTAEDPSRIVTLKKNSSGHYSVNFNSDHDDQSDDLYKIIVKRNPSGTRSLVVKKNFIDLISSQENVSNNLPVTKDYKTGINLKQISKHVATKEYEITVSPLKGSEPQINKPICNFTKKSQRFCKLKIKNVDNDDLAEPPVVLKITDSNNFILIPDKEYENEYSNIIKGLLEKDTEYYAKISQDGLNNSVIINFDVFNQPNAFLIRTDSDCLRIIRTSNSKNSASSKKRTSVVIRDLFNKLPKLINNIKNTSNLRKKSMSDSNIYEKSQSLYSNSSDLLAESHIHLKETDSGKYAVVLEKQSKDAFIKNLKSHLQKNPYGKVPVRKTENGDIIIALNENDNYNVHYGSIKITPSGNIYLTIDEDVVKQIGGVDKNPSETLSKHIIGKLAHPKNKGVTTTCNAKPKECSCDGSKCVCAEIILEKNGWYIGPANNHEVKDLPLYKPRVCGVDWNTLSRSADESYKIFNLEESCSEIREQLNPTNVTIRQCTCNPVIERKSRTEQCYYVIEATCPFHINQQNESAEVVVPGIHTNTEIYDETSENCYSITSSEIQVSIGKDWDSLGYLPPQLPSFLRDLEAKYRLRKC